MPIHRIKRSTMHEDVRELEHDGERVVSVAPDSDPAYVLVGTNWIGERDGIETRLAPLTHQARFGVADVTVGGNESVGFSIEESSLRRLRNGGAS